MSEAALALAVARWLEAQGFDVHGEVQQKNAHGRCDVVGIRGDPPEVWIVETKTGLTIDLRHQAWHRKDYGHRVFLGIPWRSRPLPAAGQPGAWTEEETFGVLYIEGDSVFVARAAPALEGRRVLATLLACTKYTRGQAGGIQRFRRGATPTPYATLLWAIHERLSEYPAGLFVGELFDVVKDLLVASDYRNPLGQLRQMLCRNDCFEINEEGSTRKLVKWCAGVLDIAGGSPPHEFVPDTPAPAARRWFPFPTRRPATTGG